MMISLNVLLSNHQQQYEFFEAMDEVEEEDLLQDYLHQP
jgi:hypothetical protein